MKKPYERPCLELVEIELEQGFVQTQHILPDHEDDQALFAALYYGCI